MTEREKLIEAMARAICAELYGTFWDVTSHFRQTLCLSMANAALSTIEAAGAVVVPVDDAAMLAASPYRREGE